MILKKKIFLLLIFFFLFNECFCYEKKKEFIKFLDSSSSELSKNKLSFKPFMVNQNAIFNKLFLKNISSYMLDKLEFSKNWKKLDEANKENFNNIHLKEKFFFRIRKENKKNPYAYIPINEDSKKEFNNFEKNNTYKSISYDNIFKNDKIIESSQLKNKEYNTSFKKEINSNNDSSNENNLHRFNEMINKEMINNFKDICNQIYKKTFDLKNSSKVHNSNILTLYKNLLEGKDKKYDLLGYGEMKDVSAYVLNYSLNDIKSIKKWNTNIKRLNYLNISKSTLLKKKSSREMLDVNKYIVNDEKDIENEKKNILYLVNSLPWPFKSHDVIYEVFQNYDESENMFIIVNKSINDLFNKNENFSRINNYENFFCIYPKKKDIFQKGLDYVISLYYNASLPKFIQNNLFSNLFPSLIYNLYSYSQKETIKKKDINHEDKMKLLKHNDLENCEKNDNKKREIQDEKYNEKLDKRNNCYIKKLFKFVFTEKINTIWKAKKNFLKKLFFYLYNLF
ncbi:StAR-related lipid transfer protein, putative [Plasmodium gallinaceum]|uniref:StAR-related lipid transfer protein, putative n=1 Tax=Plasmodium gallinaceum TaxID=5849 RepID=A0A1J1GLP4_PLAGA|nr:StAR-related lipid transfer protein, putative [Plasmodium gallinaceum]CRG93297.1 StAR-related lipid transfer protein, putative [Plasmodium gallinaceum]